MNARLLALAALLTLAGCHNRSETASNDNSVSIPNGQSPSVPFELKASSEGLLFFWFDDQGVAHPVESINAIPEARRGLVRVDPARPELRTPGWVYVSDLRHADSRGVFSVRAVRAQTLADQVLSIGNRQRGEGTSNETAAIARPSGQPDVVVYGASWCSACHQAAAYLRARHVAFVEKDIERDPEAAREMQTKAARAGVSTGSIPIIDVRGHILRGFSAEAIEQALQSG